MSVTVPRKLIWQINPKIIEIRATNRQGFDERRGEEALRKAVGYGFHSDEL